MALDDLGEAPPDPGPDDPPDVTEADVAPGDGGEPAGSRPGIRLRALFEPSPRRPEEFAESEWAHMINTAADAKTGDPGDASRKTLGESVALCIDTVFGSARWPVILYPIKAFLAWLVGAIRRSKQAQAQDAQNEEEPAA